MSQLSDYTNLVTNEHADKPNFNAVLAAVLQPLVDINNTLASMPAAYDIDNAVGAQLDTTALWIGGIPRGLPTPISGVFFAFDTANVGFDQGIWYVPPASTTQITKLDDDTFRAILQAQIAFNQWDGTVAGLFPILQSIFTAPGVGVIVQDNFDMTMTVGTYGQQPSVLLQAILSGGYLRLKPAAVGIIYSSTTGPAFGFDQETGAVSGFDVGAWAKLS
jgi:hypothetical protein